MNGTELDHNALAPPRRRCTDRRCGARLLVTGRWTVPQQLVLIADDNPDTRRIFKLTDVVRVARVCLAARSRGEQ